MTTLGSRLRDAVPRAAIRARRVPLSAAGAALVAMAGLGVWWPALAVLLAALAVAVAAPVLLGRWALLVSVWVMALPLLWIALPRWDFGSLAIGASVVTGLLVAAAALELLERAGLKR